MSNVKTPEILRQDEAWQIASSIDDLITKQLLSRACVCILNEYVQKKEELVADFDLRFFSDAMLKFCGDHENLKRILAGEDLRWFDDEENV